MIPNPKFSEGEVVILWPVDHPELRGKNVIIDKRYYDAAAENIKGQKIASWIYNTSSLSSIKLPCDPEVDPGWFESALRPKPYAKGIGLEEFMTDLLSKEVVLENNTT